MASPLMNVKNTCSSLRLLGFHYSKSDLNNSHQSFKQGCTVGPKMKVELRK